MVGQGIINIPESLVDVVDRALEGDAEAEGVSSGKGAVFPNKGKDGQKIHVKGGHRGALESTVGRTEEASTERVAREDGLVIDVLEEDIQV